MLTSNSIIKSALSKTNTDSKRYYTHLYDDKLFVNTILEFVEKYKDYGKFSICKFKSKETHYILKYEIDKDNPKFQIYQVITPYITDNIKDIFENELKQRGFLYGMFHTCPLQRVELFTMCTIYPELYSLITETDYKLLSKVCEKFEMFDKLQNIIEEDDRKE